MKGGWKYALLPVAGGLVIATLLADVVALDNPIFTVRIQLGTLSLLVGGLLSCLIAGGMVVWAAAERHCRVSLASLRVQSAEEHRRFIQRLDHELKNPLTAIRAGLANIAGEAVSPGQEQALSSMESQVLRLSRLTSDLRKLTELETRPLPSESVAIGVLLEEVVLLAQEQHSADTRQLRLSLPEVPWPVPDIRGDWDLLFLAIYNLVDNALKFTQPGDTVVVRAFEDGTSVVVEVADTGPGIASEDLPRVWEELYRGQGARGIPGSGLGLALVRAIIERHAGQVSLRSRTGQGTVVTVRLPIS
jgi:two-component system OmpR family sensor kinase